MNTSDFYTNANDLWRIPESPDLVKFIPSPVPWINPEDPFHPYWDYITEEDIDPEEKTARCHFVGPRDVMPLMRDVWKKKMKAQGFAWDDLIVTFYYDPRKNQTPASVLKARAHARIDAAQKSGEVMTPQKVAAHTRWAAPRDNWVAGHLVHVLPSGHTVQTADAAGNPIPLEAGPMYPSLGALRVAIYRGKVPGLLPASPRPKEPKVGKKKPRASLPVTPVADDDFLKG